MIIIQIRQFFSGVEQQFRGGDSSLCHEICQSNNRISFNTATAFPISERKSINFSWNSIIMLILDFQRRLQKILAKKQLFHSSGNKSRLDESRDELRLIWD